MLKKLELSCQESNTGFVDYFSTWYSRWIPWRLFYHFITHVRAWIHNSYHLRLASCETQVQDHRFPDATPSPEVTRRMKGHASRPLQPRWYLHMSLETTQILHSCGQTGECDQNSVSEILSSSKILPLWLRLQASQSFHAVLLPSTDSLSGISSARWRMSSQNPWGTSASHRQRDALAVRIRGSWTSVCSASRVGRLGQMVGKHLEQFRGGGRLRWRGV